ncbi:ribosome rescue GTPase HflX [Pseudothauera rhizosphaerae]|uniref:GTPase HflX n=1 Tax=Pseudothauera rhizosphaerae TaxID=2565932 RepID=A0A4S4AJZ9_9RHOO|nr:ribosome rescue GTPase HflX [Pseudothauera rhizosphaerae]THF59233.1 GTPase HflX [Pseudothauera rhizosphaerae]
MFERPASGERAVLVQLDLGQGAVDERLSELQLLATSAGATVEAVVRGRRAAPDSALFAGRGKVEEIAETLRVHDADLVIFNHALSPAQQRNLERALECRVIDRTALILDIFALRARSHEGKLQVELAQLQHLATRLVRGWTHLERQKGGIGLRGPGETQLETDRRLLGQRVKMLKTRLAQLGRQRQTRRRQRERRDVLSVSLVGYTNAGKSTLFNTLTKAGAYAADQLFATLDTTSRKLFVGGGNVVLSDTVGFIRDLPHALVAAFEATLEETASADVLLHVVDSASEDRDAQIEAVNQVLAEIGAGDVPQILVWNKIDLTRAAPAVERDDYGRIRRVFLSARTGEGLGLLRDALAEAAHDHASSASPGPEAGVTHAGAEAPAQAASSATSPDTASIQK